MAYYEWQRERLPHWQSFAFNDLGLNRLQDCQCSVRVNVSSQRVCYTSPAHLGVKGSDGDFLLRFQVGGDSCWRCRLEDNYKFYDLTSSALLHFGNAQANFVRYSTSVRFRYNSMIKNFPNFSSPPSAIPDCSLKVTRNRVNVIISTQAQVVEVERSL